MRYKSYCFKTIRSITDCSVKSFYGEVDAMLVLSYCFFVFLLFESVDINMYFKRRKGV